MEKQASAGGQLSDRPLILRCPAMYSSKGGGRTATCQEKCARNVYGVQQRRMMQMRKPSGAVAPTPARRSSTPLHRDNICGLTV
jgi:hypothetical protein